MRVCAVLDTGEGPNFFRCRDIPRIYIQISSGVKPTISNANGRPLNIVGKTDLYVRFGIYVVKCHLFVCESLDTTYVLGGGFLYWFVEAKRHYRDCFKSMTVRKYKS